MNRRYTILLLVIVFATGATAFVTGRLIAARRQGRFEPVSGGWLRNAPARLRQSDRQFEDRAKSLMDRVASEKSRLSSLLRDPGATENEILAQVDRVITSHTALMNAVGGHLVELRDNLPQRQRRHLMVSCGNSLQHQMQRRFRWRGGQSDAQWQGQGYGGGRGQGGQGRGRGRQYRGGRGDEGGPFARRLELTDAQISLAQERDPNFAADSALLAEQVRSTCADLLASFEDATVSDEDLVTKIRGLTEAHNALEKRVAEHVVRIRPDLSDGQREILAELAGATQPPDPNKPVSSGVNPIDILGSAGQASTLTALLDLP